MLKALLVDDEQNNLDNLDFMLKHDCEGVVVSGMAHNADEARQWLKNNSVDILFLDINMPGETGFDLLRSLPQHHDHTAVHLLRRSLQLLLKKLNWISTKLLVLLHQTQV